MGQDLSRVNDGSGQRKERSIIKEAPGGSTEPDHAGKKHRSTASVSSGVSMKSDRSKGKPPAFSPEPAPSDSRHRSTASLSSGLSMKSARSKGNNPNFSHEPAPSDSQ
ncbi:hypothetical protein WMY93_010408 [Mugilogobius chulae]|uniref:Uncharacterized protein n=1 Tax=Mugilogobius chulae TaxID=88201 RepID=A0AAW0PB22_9GOBI